VDRSGILEYEERMMGNGQNKRIEVFTYSGYKANERPVYFFLNSQRVEVKEILDRWYGEEHDHFKVLADDGKVYVLRWQRYSDVWTMVKVFPPSHDGTDHGAPHPSR